MTATAEILHTQWKLRESFNQPCKDCHIHHPTTKISSPSDVSGEFTYCRLLLTYPMPACILGKRPGIGGSHHRGLWPWEYNGSKMFTIALVFNLLVSIWGTEVAKWVREDRTQICPWMCSGGFLVNGRQTFDSIFESV